MKTHFLFICLCCFIPSLRAQEAVIQEISEEQQYSTLSTNEVVTEIGLIPESLDANVDSLMHSWHVQYFTQTEAFCHDDDANVIYPDSIYRQRMESLPNLIKVPYNKVVRECIELYAGRRRGLVRYMMGMADYYFPLVEQVLDEYDLPLELKYLAVVESALNPVALSRVGATGMWQFMLPTAKSYGLVINSLVDERCDPVKSTHAACKYFKDMYAIYGDWSLVLAAYNCGPGNVNKALRKAGGKTDFWEIFPYLPKETRSYVPLFAAANYIMTYYCEHNLCPIQTDLPLATDTVMINKTLHFEQVSEVLGLNVELIQALNPQYKRDIVAGSPLKPAILKLPAYDTYAFADKADSIYAHRTEELLANCVTFDPSAEGKIDISTREKVSHIAKSGENLYSIAHVYGVTARDIRKWNGLSSNRVAQGKRLTVYVDNGGVKFAATPSQQSTTPAAKAEVKTAEKQLTSNAAPANPEGYTTYTVRSGDSLYTIAKKYPGISTALLQKANNLTNNNIRPGQVLKIPVG